MFWYFSPFKSYDHTSFEFWIKNIERMLSLVTMKTNKEFKNNLVGFTISCSQLHSKCLRLNCDISRLRIQSPKHSSCFISIMFEECWWSCKRTWIRRGNSQHWGMVEEKKSTATLLLQENTAAQPRVVFSCARAFTGVQKENSKMLFLFH